MPVYSFSLFHATPMDLASIVEDHIPPPAPLPSNPEYEKMTCAQLKEILKERGLAKSGNKADLILRLVEDDEGRGPHTEWTSTDTPSTKTKRFFKKENVGPTDVSLNLTPLQC
jgi:hypothetical protein